MTTYAEPVERERDVRGYTRVFSALNEAGVRYVVVGGVAVVLLGHARLTVGLDLATPQQRWAWLESALVLALSTGALERARRERQSACDRQWSDRPQSP